MNWTMMLSVSAWDLQANSVEINYFNLLFWSHRTILMDLVIDLLIGKLELSFIFVPV